jgi:CheY-like chemotaxis protein
MDTKAKLEADCLILLDDVPLHNLIADKMLGYNNLLMPRQIFSEGQELLDFLQKPADELPKRILMLVDLMMPEMSGLDIAEHVLELPHEVQSRCRMFIVSSTIDDRDIEAIEQHPAVECFLNKPLDASRVSDILQQPVPNGKWGTAA